MFESLRKYKHDFLISAALAVTTFLVYLFSLCPTVYLIDSGELAAVSYTLGIAHPTGYPLYTLISYFFAHIPGEPIKNLNLLSALFSVTAVVFLYLTAKQILKNSLISIICASIFAFSPTIWRTSVTNEVYPLTGLFVVIIIYAFYKLHSQRSFYILMYLIGLSLTNHMVIFSVALPIFLYIVVCRRPSIRIIITGVLFSILGVSLYLYLITRTIGCAEFAWGNIYNLQRLYWHVTGKQYQVWMFSCSINEVFSNLSNGLKILLRDFLFVFTIPVFFGFYYLFKSDKKKFWLFLSVFLLSLLYTINYSIPDVESYYIPGLISLIFVFAYGLKLISRNLKWFTVLSIAFIIPVINYRSCTLRNNTFGLDFGRVYIEQLPRFSLLMGNYWDIYSPLIYLTKVKGIRPDLIIIDKELLRRTWYIKYLEKEYPQFYQKSAIEIEDYLVELNKFEYDKPYNPNVIQAKFINMLKSFVDVNIDQGVYFAMVFPDQDLKQVRPEYYRIVNGLVFKIQSDTIYAEFDYSKLDIKRPRIINDERLSINIDIVKRMLNYNVVYLNLIKKTKEAEQAKAWLKNF